MLSKTIQNEIKRLSEEQNIDSSVLEQFAYFVLLDQNNVSNQKNKANRKKPLKMAELKEAVLGYFNVKDTKNLRKSSEFKLATEGLDNLNFKKKDSWEVLFRQFVGILPEDEGEEGIDCINGINIFKYFRPWQVFGLNPKEATEEDIKSAYRELSKKYHPDNSKTGNSKIFDRVNTMYQAINPKAFQN